MFDEQAVFIEPERLFDLDQHLFGQPVPMLLLENQAAEQAAPDQASQRQEQRLDRREAVLERTEQQRKGHGNQHERSEDRQANHLLPALIDFGLVQRIENGEGLLYAFGNHDRIASPRRLLVFTLRSNG